MLLITKNGATIMINGVAFGGTVPMTIPKNSTLAVSYDGKNVSCFVNGKQVATTVVGPGKTYYGAWCSDSVNITYSNLTWVAKSIS